MTKIKNPMKDPLHWLGWVILTFCIVLIGVVFHYVRYGTLEAISFLNAVIFLIVILLTISIVDTIKHYVHLQ